MTDEIFFDDVSLSFGRREIFSHVTLNLRGGRIIGVTGITARASRRCSSLREKLFVPTAAVSPCPKIFQSPPYRPT
ncbi:MAG: hypothetical protein SR1Q7_02950 [Quinella sp. 1Q7]|nr:hypothetical protein [Quinella sp. 1Q7]